MCFKIRKWFIVLLVCIVVFLSCFLSLPTLSVLSPNTPYVIVIDPGHGGIDNGTIGVETGKDENSLNLDYALTLKTILENYGIKVVMTRNNLNGLYSQFAKDKKIDDMEKRAKIINGSGAHMMISIHMNSFPLQICKGAQVFFKETNINGQKLAENIQEIFIKTLPNARTESLKGDYYVLNCTEIPSVIVECGYLSNPEEEQLLQTEDYKNLVCYSIFVGILKFLAS